MNIDVVKISKFMSLVLRHDPGKIGLTLDENGWAEVADLLQRMNDHGRRIDREILEHVVATNDKKRFSFTDDGQKIRANQGHSIDIDLALSPQTPPDVLFHGTATRFLDSIREQGLLPGSRQHVHLSRDETTAIKVGQRHGKPVVLVVRAGEMHRQGISFFCSDNGVWLTDCVAPQFIEFPS